MERELRTIQPGTHVYSSDDEHVGDVEEVGPNYVLARKGWLFVKERYIPFDAVSRVASDRIYLTVTKDQLDTIAWDEPPAASAGALTAGAGTVGAQPVQASPATPEIAAGGVQARTRDDDVPVAEPVRLRDEVAPSERRAGAAVVGGTELAAFQEGTIEVRALHEEIIVGKQARVVEEIVLRTDAVERIQTIQDTVRRTRVDVAEVAGQSTAGAAATSVAPASTPVDQSVPEGGASEAQQRGSGSGRGRLS